MLDPNPHIAALKESRARLDVDTADLCCLVMLRALEQEASDIEEDFIVERLATVHEWFGESESHRLRAANGLQRFLNQRLLTRVNAPGLARKGLYALSPLGRAIVEFFVTDDRLTRESLLVLTGTLHASLLVVRDRAIKADTPEAWAGVTAPLSIAATDLLDGIHRRARGLDADQDRQRAGVARMLEEDWFSALDRAEAMLVESTQTLAELSRVLLDEQAALEGILDEIEARAHAAGEHAAEAAARNVAGRVAALTDWGRRRHETWSQYLQLMLGTLRAIIRLDPDRAMSQRLRDGIRAGTLPGYLTLPVVTRTAVLRDQKVAPERPEATRPRESEREPERVAPVVEVTVEQHVDDALGAGATTLTEVLRIVLPKTPDPDRYRAVGRVAQHLARSCRIDRSLEPDWTAVLDGLSVTDWNLGARR
jgi:chromosome partition protein MukF